MSADNWTHCPRCVQRRDEGDAEQQIPPLDETLREDYELGIHKGRFAVSYSASCSDCGFQFTYQYDQPIS